MSAMLSKSKPDGFDFDLCKRNAFLEKEGLKTLKPWSTGTTIAGVVFKVRQERRAAQWRDGAIAGALPWLPQR